MLDPSISSSKPVVGWNIASPRNPSDRTSLITSIVVTASQMRDIEGRIFAAGMPVAALMEKVAGRIFSVIQALIPLLWTDSQPSIGILVGPGHNGGDALVVARELYLAGYCIKVYCPFTKLKGLTAQHYQYLQSLGVVIADQVEILGDCQILIDGLFGFGLERPLEGAIANSINTINTWSKPVISIDLPSGLHTDTGAVLGTAIRATHTLCLGLWKRGLLTESALDYVGTAQLIDFDIPIADINAVIPHTPVIRRITKNLALSGLPLPRKLNTYKYKEGHLLIICGSRHYGGAAIITGLSARASGVGMLSIAVPHSLKPILLGQLPDALIIDCPETTTGVIDHLPDTINLDKYNAIACGPGLTVFAKSVVETVLNTTKPLLLDADGLNILAELGAKERLQTRQAATVITPHAGEFQRLFPHININDNIQAAQMAASSSQAIVLLKGARTVISHPQGDTWILPHSTPALARGGSGDVLTGLMAGLITQGIMHGRPLIQAVTTATWWHSQGGIIASQERSELGVDARTLCDYLLKVVA